MVVLSRLHPWVSTPLFDCVLHNASYDLRFSYESNIPSITVKTTVHDAVNATFVSDKVTQAINAAEGLPSGEITAVPGETHDVASYVDSETWSLVNLVAIRNAFVEYLAGYVDTDRGEPVKPHSGTLIMSTNLVTAVNASAGMNQITFISDLPSKVEELFRNVTVSLLSADFSTVSSMSVLATTNTYNNVYSYDEYARRIFWASYGAGLGVAVLCVCLGIVCVLSNSFPGQRNFSQIFVSTRNKTLDTLCQGVTLGKPSVNPEKQKLILGALRGGVGQPINKYEHRFGFRSEVTNKLTKV